MMGTLAGALARKGITVTPDGYRADIEGDIEDVAGVLKITTIRVNYYIEVPQGRTAEARAALSEYIASCPAAQTLMGCVKIEDKAEIKELAD